MKSDVSQSSDRAPVSGVYRALHTIPHESAERELYLVGSRLPECRVCGNVIYILESPVIAPASPSCLCANA
jgi:hypothetical protein